MISLDLIAMTSVDSVISLYIYKKKKCCFAISQLELTFCDKLSGYILIHDFEVCHIRVIPPFGRKTKDTNMTFSIS